jgi:hypothetical protein
LSVRVPWHDGGWDGSVCGDPLSNSSCILLKNIGEKREDLFEFGHAGQWLADLDRTVPCVAERATFMSARDHAIPQQHPYGFSPALQNMAPATVPVPAWSVHAIPYYWLHRDNLDNVMEQRPIDGFSQDAEEHAIEQLGWRPGWLLHGDNQQAVIETFFQNVQPSQSLVFFYLKHSPFEDAGARLLVGAALVDDLTLPGRWPTNGPTAFPNHMWETVVRHTLRPDGTGGVLLPLQELAKLTADGTDVSAALAQAPNVRDFSYVTEHVSADTTVAALLELRRAADAAVELGCSVPPASLTWLDEQLSATWERRGPSPGLPAVLPQLGWAHPTFAAHTLAAAAGTGDDPWLVLVDALEDRDVPRQVQALATKPRKTIWASLEATTKRALQLLARFSLTAEEVTRVLEGETEAELPLESLLENPYDLVNCTVDDDAPIPFSIVDRGCFPDPALAARHPLPVNEPFEDAIDARRVEAALTSTVANAQSEGHTLLPVPQVLERLDAMVLAQRLHVTTTVLDGLGLTPAKLDADPAGDWPPLACTVLADGSYAYKLRSAIARVEGISDFLGWLRSAQRHQVPDGLEDEIDAVLGPHDPPDHAEERARQEKRAALRELYASRLALLNGPAGTGKTTLIRALAQRPEVTRNEVLLLAPTGKARVQLENKIGMPARTLASFLNAGKRYEGDAARYRATGDAQSRQRFGTVVVDEASMLTEDMLDALLDALVPPDRLVLVGDPRQLPPIGAGRPFVDLERAARENHAGDWPHVAPGWTELTVLRRQKESDGPRDDLMLARWFSGDELPESFDDVWHRLRRGEEMDTLGAVPWEGHSATRVIDHVLYEELGVAADDEGRSFATSYGATLNDTWINYFEAPGSCEQWQILSPLRGRGHGTVQLNRHLKQAHRRGELDKALRRKNRHVPKPLGSEQVVLGDKVVNLRNQSLPSWPHDNGKKRTYVANGEIGVVIGQITGQGKRPPKVTQVEFSSQPGLRVTVNPAVSESDTDVELAWALTVHKSQGSEFGTVFLVLPSGARNLSRELLYTALTRQTDRIVLCHEGPLDELMALTRATGSDAARRFTDLVRPAEPRAVSAADGSSIGALDAGLVHVTGGGVLVRSKNEVIIAGILDELAAGAWSYEQPLHGSDGRTRLPDFTITAPTGQTVYWEHLGMLNDPGYADGWERKKAWYAEQGILPLDEGGGPGGALVWTDDRDGVDAPAWHSLAESFLSGGPDRPERGRRRKR